MADPIKADDPEGVARKSAAVEKMTEAWTLAADLMGGTTAMREAGRRRMPQWPNECEAGYDCRLLTATLFPAYQRTVNILTGKPFSKPLTVGEDVPPRVAALLDDVDTEGRNLDSFAADLCLDALAYGFAGILVDVPRTARPLRTVAEEQAAGVRPYFVHVKHDQVLGWRAEKNGSRMQLTQLRILESVEEPDGAFAVKTVEQVRVLEPGKWTLWRKVKGADGRSETWQVYDEGATSIPVVPFAPVYGRRKDFMIGEPPMIDLAHLNVEHWQSESDQRTILHVARVPILFVNGFREDEDIAVGPGAVMRAESPDADAKFVEHSGAAIEAGRLSLLDLEDRMRQIGAELLVIKPGNTTVVQTRSDNEPAMCDLQRIAQALEDALDLALYYAALFLGESDGGHVSIYSDFGVSTQTEASAQLLVEMNADGKLSDATTLNELKRRGVLSADVDVDAEIAAAGLERDAMQDKAAERERAMAMQNMAYAAQQEMDASPVPPQEAPARLTPLNW
ncbi:hypothetical protein HK102_010172 [Quaeritorhiza haematococci]|nr:hypothetical protein HK102_010172 [Quaeritorhiza haematococci]